VKKTSRYIFASTLLIISLLLPSLSFCAVEKDPAPGFWGQVIISKEAQLRALSRGVALLSMNVDKKVAELSELTSCAGPRFHELYFLLLVNRRSPYDLEMIYSEIDKLNNNFAAKISEVEKVNNYLNSIQGVLTEIDATLDKLNVEAPNEKEKNAVRNIRNIMTKLKAQITPNALMAAEALKKAEELKKNLDANMKKIDQDIPSHLKNIMLKPELNIFSREIWMFLPFGWEQWRMQLPNIFFQKLPDNKDKYIAISFIFLFFGFPLFLLGIIFYRKKFPGMKKKYPVAHVLLRRGWLILVIAISFLANGTVLKFPETIAFYRLGVILVSWSAIDFVWCLKRIFIQKEHPTPLIPLFWLYVTGISYQFLNIPYSMLFILWPLTVALIMFFMNRKKKDKLPSSEKWIVRISLWAGLIMLFMSFGGYVYLSMFISLTWFMVCLGVQFGSTINFIIRHYYGKANNKQHELRRILIIGLGIPLIWFSIIVFVMIWIVTQFGEITLFRSLLGTKLHWKNLSISILDVAMIVFLFFVFKSLSGVISTSLTHLASKKKNERGLFPLLKVLTFYSLWGVWILLTLFILKVNFTSLAVILGGMSVGIGFGLQNIVNNITSGLIIMFGKSLHEGDIIQINETWATVLRINMRTTLVETFDHAIIEMPNSEIITNRFTNWTMNDNNIRRDIPVGVAYGSDIRKVEKVLLDVAASHPAVLKEPMPSVLLLNFGSSSIDFALRVWLNDISRAMTIQSDIRKIICDEFTANNIEISFPQLDIHLKDAKTIPVNIAEKTNI